MLSTQIASIRPSNDAPLLVLARSTSTPARPRLHYAVRPVGTITAYNSGIGYRVYSVESTVQVTSHSSYVQCTRRTRLALVFHIGIRLTGHQFISEQYHLLLHHNSHKNRSGFVEPGFTLVSHNNELIMCSLMLQSDGSAMYYLLTPWCTVLLEKLTGLQLVKKFPAFHGTPRFITALTSVRHLSLSWASPISPYTHIPPPGDPS